MSKFSICSGSNTSRTPGVRNTRGCLYALHFIESDMSTAGAIFTGCDTNFKNFPSPGGGEGGGCTCTAVRQFGFCSYSSLLRQLKKTFSG